MEYIAAMYDLLTVENVIALFTLTALEIVLGIDNIVILAIISGRLPKARQTSARRIGLGLAMIMRIVLLLSISVIMRLNQPLFAVVGHSVTGRDLVLLGGGLFLMWKSVKEIHEHSHTVGGAGNPEVPGFAAKASTSFAAAIGQIVLLDLVFSLDSVITAVGMAKHVPVMVAAIICAVLVMMVFANVVCDFVNRYPSIRMLALAFLMLVGVFLVAEGLGKHIERGYIYFAMAFSLGVEFLNLRFGGRPAAHPAEKLRG
jgi:predicted tellurium resistance membrane protein TerC